MNKYIPIFFLIVFLSCASKKNVINNPISKKILEYKTSDISDDQMKKWYYLDIERDAVAGISLDKANEDFLKGKKGKNITVAILDSEIDINHKGLKNNIWVNSKEMPNNGIDDDDNNYVDDVNGWNFLGNTNNENITDANYEYVRIYRYFQHKFKDADTTNLEVKSSKDYDSYKKSKKVYLEKRDRSKRQFDFSNDVTLKYENAKKAIRKHTPEDIFIKENLTKLDTVGNGLYEHVKFMLTIIRYGETAERMETGDKLYKDRYNKRSNVDFNERKLIGDDSNDLSDVNYGNNKVYNHLNEYSHGTKMAGTILGKNIEIMPVCISPKGDEHDKDIALAIRYAVDNGAKVINMSFGKEHSLYKEWVFDAFKYAEKNNVLIVTSAGNGRLNLDIKNYYPNDNVENEEEVSDNLLMVGASTASANENLYASYSNYGRNDVDIFAPGEEIYTTIPDNKYVFDGGTSLASALTSKVAALIFSHYPNLTASQVKHIIMDSGVEYAFPVKTPTREDKDKMTPFNELSKSGKIINAYNALIMADSISKKNVN